MPGGRSAACHQTTFYVQVDISDLPNQLHGMQCGVCWGDRMSFAREDERTLVRYKAQGRHTSGQTLQLGGACVESVRTPTCSCGHHQAPHHRKSLDLQIQSLMRLHILEQK